MELQVPIDTGGNKPTVVLPHGFAMRPSTYSGLVELLERRCRVVVPDLFAIRGRWRYEEISRAFVDTLEHVGVDAVTLIGHSFGGGIELGFAARHPERVVELVFSDTLADSREWGLADEALRRPGRLVQLATPRAISAFGYNCVRHPRQLVGAALWAFQSSRRADSTTVARAGIPSHVLWANRDSILSRADGARFAEELGANFVLADPEPPMIVDHDWMFEQPDVFFSHLESMGIRALGGGSV